MDPQEMFAEEKLVGSSRKMRREVEADLVEINMSDDIEENIELWVELVVIRRVVRSRYERRQIKYWIKENWKAKVVA